MRKSCARRRGGKGRGGTGQGPYGREKALLTKQMPGERVGDKRGKPVRKQRQTGLSAGSEAYCQYVKDARGLKLIGGDMAKQTVTVGEPVAPGEIDRQRSNHGPQADNPSRVMITDEQHTACVTRAREEGNAKVSETVAKRGWRLLAKQSRHM